MIMRVNFMKNDDGISLVGAIMMVVMVGVLGVMASALLVSKMGASSFRLASIKAQFVAEGGLERGIQQYKADCSGYTGETNVALGQGRFAVQLYTTSFDGVTALTGQRRILSTGYIPSATNPVAVKVVQQIATCPGSTALAVTSKGGITMNGSAKIVCGTQTCTNSDVQSGSCTCSKKSSTTTYPVVTVPNGLSAPASGCTINSGTFTWAAGTYYCSNLIANSTVVVNLGGAVTLYVDSFTLNSNSSLNLGGQAKNLLVMVTGSGSAIINTNAYLTGFLYVPGGSLTLNSGAHIVGAVVGNSVMVNDSSDVTWDKTAGTGLPAFTSSTGLTSGSDTTIDWREPPLQ